MKGEGAQPPPKFLDFFQKEIQKPIWVSSFQKHGRRLDRRRRRRRLLLPDPDGGGTASSHQFSGACLLHLLFFFI
ncbi:hypothetical protein ACOSP7_010638 [Xanthoceras sorbifolium]